MKDQYNATFLASTLILLQSNIHELHRWSVYNDDELNEELAKLDEVVADIVNKAMAFGSKK